MKQSLRILDRYEDCRISSGREPSKLLIDEFDRTLADSADEKPLQTLLANHSSLLGPLSLPGGDYWCLDRPRLGAEFVPDFLVASITSVGFRWVMIELESPTEPVLTKAGLPAKKLAEGLKQIRDWRTWLTDNVAYARSELGLKDIEAASQAYVIIGRRASLDPKQAKQYRALSADEITVMTYDRLRDVMGGSASSFGADHG